MVFRVNPPKKKDKNKLHTVFYGNPGVGKSKTAKVLSLIWKALGIIHCCKDGNKKKNCKNILKDINKFTEVVLPKYWNFSSFIQQLNIYGFTKVRSG
jgi:Holliday junction resolvasome RuvABC ATP-dependent DNA helicase subunit